MSTTTTVYALTKPTTGGDAGVWGNPVDANFDTLDNELARPRTVFLSPTVGATTTLDLSQTTGARTFVFTVSQATTIAFSNVPSSSFTARIQLLITNGSAFVLTWPASVVWLSGVAPTLKSAGVDLVEMVTRDGGSTWYAGALDRPLNRLVGQVTTDAGTGANSTEVTLHTIAIPANILGPNGALRIRVHYTVTGTANSKQINIYYGGQQIMNAVLAAADQVGSGVLDLAMINRNATGAQHFAGSFTKNNTTMGWNSGTGTADTTTAQNLLVKAQTVNSADEVTANASFVELLRS